MVLRGIMVLRGTLSFEEGHRGSKRDIMSLRGKSRLGTF